jgi:hypothetical protein
MRQVEITRDQALQLYAAVGRDVIKACVSMELLAEDSPAMASYLAEIKAEIKAEIVAAPSWKAASQAVLAELASQEATAAETKQAAAAAETKQAASGEFMAATTVFFQAKDRLMEVWTGSKAPLETRGEAEEKAEDEAEDRFVKAERRYAAAKDALPGWDSLD